MSSTHTITFTKLRANFVKDTELIGKQDPYVVFHSGSAKVQTKAIKGVGTGTAEWKESYSLDNFSPSSSSIVEVTVYNHNTLLPDTVIGSGTVDLSTQGESSLSGSGEPISINLVDKKGSETGTLQFLVNGGGYSGRSSSRSGAGGVGAGYGSSSGTAGYGQGTQAGVGTEYRSGGSGIGSGSGSGIGSGSGSVVGQGVGSDKQVAQEASDRAAREGREVTIEERDRVAVGKPVQTGVDTSSSRGVSSGVTSGVSGERAAVYGEREGDVIDRKYYVGTEARPQDQALVEQYREHNPYAKDYETTVQHTGRERLVASQIEALGTRERVIGQDHHVHAHPLHEIARNLPAGAIAERPGGEGWINTKPGPICDTNTFSITGDRTVDKERVTDLREHREFEKEFEVKTRLVGERALERGTEAEILNRERVLVDEKDKIACEGHPNVGAGVGGETLASTGAGYGSTGSGYGSQTGSGYGSGTGSQGRSTIGQKAAGYIPGTEENSDKKQGYAPGQGPDQNSGNVTTGEKVASYIPGTQENREKKQAQYN